MALRQIDRQIDIKIRYPETNRSKIWCSQTVRQIDRQIDIKIGYPETNRLNGIDIEIDRQIDRYQNQISRDKQIECHRYGSLRQIDRYQNWISRDKQIEWHRYGTLRQIERQIDIKIDIQRLNGKDMVFSDSQIDRQIDRYQNQISRDKQIEWQRYGVLRQSDRQIDRQISKLDIQRQTD